MLFKNISQTLIYFHVLVFLPSFRVEILENDIIAISSRKCVSISKRFPGILEREREREWRISGYWGLINFVSSCFFPFFFLILYATMIDCYSNL